MKPMNGWMRTGFLQVGIFALLIAINFFVPFSDSRALPLRLDRSTVAFGAYDPEGTLQDEARLKFDHVFFSWNSPASELKNIVARTEARGRELMVTLEPWTTGEATDKDGYVNAILAGSYDAAIVGLCREIGSAKRPVMVRWGHEMEIETGRYSWTGLEPAHYVDIYRYFVDACRRESPNSIFVWSPRGDRGLEAFYPGDEYVDVVGLTLFGLQPWEMAAYGKPRTFEEALAEKYRLIQAFGKPLAITEFGVCGDARYARSWMRAALRQGAKEFPLLTSIVYFNDREPHLWPAVEDMDAAYTAGCEADAPDWRLKR